MSDIETLIAQKFIARRDVKAIQRRTGAWMPHTADDTKDGPRLPWKMSDLRAHIAGQRTYGHYLLNEDSQCKLFAFDIDFEKNNDKTGYVGSWVDSNNVIHEFDAREAWLDRGHPSRDFMKVQLMLAAKALAYTIGDELDIPTAVAYSGGKGVHVYGFTGLIPAEDARLAARIVLDVVEEFVPSRGDNFFRSSDQSMGNGLRNLTIEVFPKQDSLDGKDLGNLMRLPLGKNLKNPKDPTFFIDMSKGLDKMIPLDPVEALTAPAPSIPSANA